MKTSNVVSKLAMGCMFFTVILSACTDLAIYGTSTRWEEDTKNVTVNVHNSTAWSDITVKDVPIKVTANYRHLNESDRRYHPEPIVTSIISFDEIKNGETKSAIVQFPPNSTTLWSPNSVYQLDVRIDFEDSYPENNTKKICLKSDLPERECWMHDKCLITSHDLDLLVRVVNTYEGCSECGDRPHYPYRLRGIADQFYKDWPKTIGLIGMQEVKDKMNKCPIRYSGEGEIDGAKCLERLLAEKIGGSSSSVLGPGGLGIIVGEPWVLESTASWPLPAGDRYLMEAKVRNESSGKILRFYNAHLSHRENIDHARRRNEQLDEIARIVRQRAKPGELLPIIVGDLNFAYYVPLAGENYMKLSADFEMPIISAFQCGKDGRPQNFDKLQLWVGKDETFTASNGHYVMIRYHKSEENQAIDMRGPYTIDDYTGILSDHSSPAFSFKIR